MAIELERKITTVPKPVQLLRGALVPLSKFLFPVELAAQSQEGFSKWGELAQHGCGILVASIHLSKGDIPRIITTIGATFTKEGLIALATESDITVDQRILAEFKKNIPPNYLV